LSDKYAATRPPKGKKSKSSRPSKLDRMSVQSTVTVPETISILAPDEDQEMNDTVLTTTSVATTASKTTAKKAAKGRGRKKVAKIEDNFEDENVDQEATTKTVPPSRGKRQVSRKASRSTKKANNGEQLADSSCIPDMSSRGTKRTSDGSVKDNSLTDTTVVPDRDVLQAKRGAKRTSNGALRVLETSQPPILESSVMVLEDPPSIISKKGKRPARGKAAKKAAESFVDTSEPDATAKPVQSKKPKKTATRAPLAELEPEIVQAETQRQFRSSGFNLADTIASTPKRDTPEISPDVVSSAPSTPTPARSAHPASNRKSIQRKSALTPRPSAAAGKTSVTESPQSSDAENKPPSARPSVRGLVLQPISPLRVPLHTTPKPVSPSRNHIVNRLRTEFAWEAADLDAIFAGHSPKEHPGINLKNKENLLSHVDLNRLDKKDLPDVVRVVKANMTESERNMTVEQWVRWNAQKSEDKLRAECETMVTMFERTGANAQRALEGIQHRE
jgi:hypothetical protein